ncbi:hypothetical protein [Roseovarius litoreus]|uniref:hypothetical protein n=1 Tax=Roseovarius litoreus TaxID=1155722 RepID=UPI00122D0394|nr:hypothetical protein [Roseovarius litoreus]
MESAPRKIADALRAVLASYDPPSDVIETAAAQIFVASELGRSDEQLGNLPASASVSEKELLEFQKLTGKLADLIDGMHNPALSALSGAGLIARDLLAPMQRAHELAGQARSRLEGLPEKNPGSKRMPEAPEVTTITAAFFEEITGKAPGRIVHREGEYGEWLDTLREVFEALGIKASAEKQAQAHRTRIARK